MTSVSSSSLRGLCSSCRAIPFSKLQNDGRSFSRTVGTWAEILTRRSCPFCVSVYVTIRDAMCALPISSSALDKKKIRVIWTGGDGFTITDAPPRPSRELSPKDIPVVWMDGEGNGYDVVNKNLYEQSLMGDLRPASSVGGDWKLHFVSGPGASARLLKDGQIDVSILVSWLQECLRGHRNTCAPHSLPADGKKPPCFRVIDVNNMCLINYSIDGAYVALSYVWGQATAFKLLKARESELRKRGSLERTAREIPLTIRDAIYVTRQMGAKYLWVDSLCLIQDDPDDMNANIGLMDSIYEHALFTIIAASGDDANQGIAGVRPGSRRDGLSYEVARGRRLISMPPIDNLLLRTKYNSRAWTYQESYLSCRSLIFLNDRVLFRCRKHLRAENLLNSWTFPSLPEKGPFEFGRFPQISLYDMLFSILPQYTARSMSYQSDAVKALAGILHRYGAKAGPDFLMGIPVTAFDIYLLFSKAPSRTTATTRRNGFPSWSWSGWQGGVSYLLLRGDNSWATFDSFANNWLEYGTWTQWWTRSDSRGPRLVCSPKSAVGIRPPAKCKQTQTRYMERETLTREPAASIKMPPADVQCPPDHSKSRLPRSFDHLRLPSAQTDPTRAALQRTHSLRTYPLLHFWAISLHLRTRQVQAPWCARENHIVADLYNKRNRAVGFLFPDMPPPSMLSGPGSDTKKANAIDIELIVISRGTFQVDHAPGWLQQWWQESLLGNNLCFVLYIEWVGGVAERRGIGQVRIDALEDAIKGPTWKEIVLG